MTAGTISHTQRKRARRDARIDGPLPQYVTAPPWSLEPCVARVYGQFTRGHAWGWMASYPASLNSGPLPTLAEVRADCRWH